MSPKTRRLGFLFGGRNSVEDNQMLPYQVRDDYLSPEQVSYFKMLLSAVGDIYVIIPRVSISDIFLLLNAEDSRHLSTNISEKRIDFLLCDRETMQPLVGVELDDQVNQIEKLPEQEIYIDDIFEAAKLPLVRIFISNPNNIEDLKERLSEAAGEAKEESSVESQGPLKTEWDGDPVRDKAEERFPVSGVTESISQIEEQQHRSTIQIEEQLRRPELQPQEPIMKPEEPPIRPELKPEEPLLRQEEPLQDPTLPELSPDHEEDEIEVDIGVSSGRGLVEDQPVSVPVERRFLNSEPEQTPGVDFFTGTVSEVELPLPAADLDADRSEIEPGKPGGEVKQENQRNWSLPHLPSGVMDLEQLKERMKQEVEHAAQEAVQSGAPDCPRCNATMMLRTSKRGHQFYVCVNYPYCREVKGLYE